MALSPGRLRRLAAAWLATASMLFAASGSLVFGHAAVDRECAPALASAHDHADHRITAAADEAPEHCGACHLTRTVREQAAAHQLARAGRTPELVLLLASFPLLAADADPTVTRGPPAL